MATTAQVPTSFGRELRACLRCRLIKTYDQFRETGCENCPAFNMDQDHDRVVDCTTSNFSGIISCMDPTRSWSARWLRINLFLDAIHWLYQRHCQRKCRLSAKTTMYNMFHQNITDRYAGFSPMFQRSMYVAILTG